MLSFIKNPDEALTVTYDGTKKLAVNATPPEVYSSLPVANLVAGSDGVLTVSAASINAAVVVPPNGEPSVPIGQGIQATVMGGTPGQTYYIDMRGKTNANNTRGDRVQVVVAY